MQTKSTFTFSDSFGYEIFVYKWTLEDDVTAKAVVQIAHGAAEHALRYERFARFLNQHGYIVYANDHRGHWKTAGDLMRAGIAGEGGWDAIVEDVAQLSDLIKEEYPDLPLIFFGHSMGSMIAQQYMQEYADKAVAVVLSGTFGSLGEDMDAALTAAQGLVDQQGADTPSALFGEMFAGFNQPFEPGKTGLEWLTRDDEEVQKYVDDPWCGFPFTNGMVLEMFKAGIKMWKAENETRIPNDLPVLVVSGDQDPAGGFTQAVNLLVDRYKAKGMSEITLKFYPGARHEILNETNRDEVMQDIVDWMDAQVKK
jgi:alpha-beta hydrolase superfamily lysophospholipase